MMLEFYKAHTFSYSLEEVRKRKHSTSRDPVILESGPTRDIQCPRVRWRSDELLYLFLLGQQHIYVLETAGLERRQHFKLLSFD